MKKDYEAKTRKVNELNAKLDAQIAEVLEESKLQIEDQRKKIQEAREDAQKKIASGELKEEEAAQYILNKVGAGALVQNNAIKCLTINNLCSQIKGYIDDSTNLLGDIAAYETNINKLVAQIARGNEEISSLQEDNDKKSNEITSINAELSLLNTEINSRNSSIGGINTQINDIKDKIQYLNTNTQIEPINNNNVNNSNNQGNILTYVPKNKGQNNYGELNDIPKRNNGNNENNPYTNNNSDGFGGQNYTGGNVHNPFISVAYETVDYSDLIAALDAMSRRTDVSMGSTLSHLNADAETIRQIKTSIIA
jgi:chromosome segregation ATPase